MLRNRRRLLLVLLIGLAVVLIGIWVMRLMLPAVPLGPQQTVHTTNPKMGIHTRLTDEVEEQKIKRSLAMVREMGAPWVVEYFPWAYIEGEPGRYNWVHADQVVAHASRQGLTLIARLGFVPEWARPKDTTPLYLDEEHFDDFATICSIVCRAVSRQDQARDSCGTSRTWRWSGAMPRRTRPNTLRCCGRPIR
jgi:hypothetical protein